MTLAVMPQIEPTALDGLDEIADQLRAALAHLDEERQAINATYEDVQAKLRYIEQARRMLDSTAQTGTNGHSAPVPSKREAALAVLAEIGVPMKLSEIRDEMIRRGWLAPDEKAAHALQMMLSTLVKEGKVDRPAYGVYRLTNPAPGTTGEGR